MKSQEQENTLSGLPTGFVVLDVVTGGLKPGLLYVVAGRPGTGKSSLVLTITRHVAGLQKRTVFFSLEMPEWEFSLRLTSAETDIDGHRLSRGIVTPAERSRSNQAAEALAYLPLVIDDTGGLPIDRLMERARRSKAGEGLALVVADYLQLIRPSRRWRTRKQEISEISRSLKALAKELNVPVLITSQLNSNTENRKDNRPTLFDLSESGSIDQDADVIIFLWPMNDGTRNTRLIIAKHRQGPTGEINLIFIQKNTQFIDLNSPME